MSEVVAGLMRVEEWNEHFRQPNPNGRYPICKNAVGTHVCERCGWPTNIKFVQGRPPCPAVPPDQRWGEDWTKAA